MLSELGYRTLAAESAAKALELLDANADVRLLLTDIVMPEMNGRRLAEAAVKRRAGLAVLFATGYTRVVHNGTIDPDVELIMKSFSLDALAQKVARVLRGGKAAARSAPGPGAGAVADAALWPGRMVYPLPARDTCSLTSTRAIFSLTLLPESCRNSSSFKIAH
jgi:CheY-like chemotaxis protein